MPATSEDGSDAYQSHEEISPAPSLTSSLEDIYGILSQRLEPCEIVSSASPLQLNTVDQAASQNSNSVIELQTVSEREIGTSVDRSPPSSTSSGDIGLSSHSVCPHRELSPSDDCVINVLCGQAGDFGDSDDTVSVPQELCEAVLSGSPALSTAVNQVPFSDSIATPVRSKVVGRPRKFKLYPAAIINKPKKTRTRQQQNDKSRTSSRSNTTNAATKTTVTKEKTSFRLDFKDGVFPDQFKFPKEVNFSHSGCESIVDYFFKFITNDMIYLIVDESNVYMRQKCDNQIHCC